MIKTLSCRFLVVLLPLMFSLPGWAQDGRKEAVQIDLPVLPAAQRYVELLAYPSYLAVALENNGFNPSYSSRLTLVDPQQLKLRAAVLKFTGRKGPVFTYSAGAALDLGVSESSISFPVEIDVSKVASGTVSVRLYPPLAKFIPQELLDRVTIKAQILSDVTAQQKLLAYMDGISKDIPTSSGWAPVLERIMIDAYNRGSRSAMAPGRDVGDAEPLSDQTLLFVTLIIWLVLVPGILLARVAWGRLRHRKAVAR